MNILKKSLTQRAAEAIKNNASSADLLSIKAEVSRRIQEVDSALKAKQREVDDAMGTGDPEALRMVRQSQSELQDEDLMLHRQQSDLARSIGITKGEEAVKAYGQHRKNLESALKRAKEAQETLADCERIARGVMRARTDAAQIGEALVFSADTIRDLAAAIFPEGNERKQAMIDLGIREAKRVA